MTTLLDSHEIYPAFYFPISPTFAQWVKLTARDVHRLRTTPEFESQGILFHLNHPIKYVRLIATIIGIERINRYLILTLDDHSGATIEAKITCVTAADIVARGEEAARNAASNSTRQTSAIANTNCRTSNVQTPANRRRSGFGDGFDTDFVANSALKPPAFPTLQEKIAAVAAAGVRETNIKNVEVISALGQFSVLLDGSELDIGSVVKAKCTLRRWRNEMQLQIERVSLIRDTNEEVKGWAETSRYRAEVLGMPWVLSKQEMKAFDRREEKGRRERERWGRAQAEHERRKRERQVVYETKIREAEEKEERKRRGREERYNDGALV